MFSYYANKVCKMILILLKNRNLAILNWKTFLKTQNEENATCQNRRSEENYNCISIRAKTNILNVNE